MTPPFFPISWPTEPSPPFLFLSWPTEPSPPNVYIDVNYFVFIVYLLLFLLIINIGCIILIIIIIIIHLGAVWWQPCRSTKQCGACPPPLRTLLSVTIMIDDH